VTCPSCGTTATVLIMNVQTQKHFCSGCAPSSFLPNFILTVDDVGFMMDCGINPELSPALMDAVLAHTSKLK
jgi:hypothetical protein